MDLSTGQSARVEEGVHGHSAARALIVGADGIALAATVQKLVAGPDPEAQLLVEQAESILEAVLMSGGGGRLGEVPVILAGVSQEIDQLEPAVRSLRKVYPESRIVLLCDPGDEVLCRKARHWGASDYIILPVDAASLRRVVLEKAPSPSPRPRIPEEPPPRARPENHAGKAEAPQLSPAEVLKNVVGIKSPGVSLEQAMLRPPQGASAAPSLEEVSLPGLPLLVQTVLFSDLLTGRSDFAERVVATLQGYIKWGGTLKYVAAIDGGNGLTGGTPQQLRAAVEFPGHGSFGSLVLDLAEGAGPTSATVAALNQSGQWLGALLAVLRRHEQLRSLAITDELSGAYNRRYFMKFMSGLLERARENRFRVTLLMFDIDDFKKYNDSFGHSSGDAIIRELIKLLRACTRPHDIVARIGGDEFAVVYWDNEAPRQPNSEHPRDALVATERFRKAVETHQWAALCKIKGSLSISGGLATFPWDADSLETLMARADEALLKAKAAGKNVIFLHEAAPAAEALEDEPAEEEE